MSWYRVPNTVWISQYILTNNLLYSGRISFLREKGEMPLLDHCVLVLWMFRYPQGGVGV